MTFYLIWTDILEEKLSEAQRKTEEYKKYKSLLLEVYLNLL